ncbi:GNAT family N-acetyltransferase [Mesorhizobium sp. CAU 1732]|uniref:GNAT family N-acetyltransferase n=1 Tax=Mesorhizobium sp. CAU 1732 TaxID=3140358 RepID=UPI0032615035
MARADTAPPGDGPPLGYAIRPHRPDDDPALLGIENRAAQLFRQHGYPEIADNPFASVADFRAMAKGHEVWVATTAGGEPAGYAVAGPLGSFLHLRELSVDPVHGRKGLGAALVRRVVQASAARGLEGVSLTTFRAVPFNQPFYETLGFSELPLDSAPPALREAFLRELPEDVAPAARVLMVRATDG